MTPTTPISAVTLIVGIPGHTPRVVAHTAYQAQVGALTALGGITIEWRRPTPRDHEEGGTIQLDFLDGEPDAIPTGSRLEVWAQVGPDLILIGLGWATSVIWEPGPLGENGRLWRYRVTCDNAPARAAGIKLAALPWPVHTQRARLDAINTAARLPLISDEWLAVASTDVGYIYAARDVDNYPALEAIHRTAVLPTTDPRIVVEGHDGLTIVPLPGWHLNWPTAVGDTLQIGGSVPVHIPARAIEQRPRHRDRTSRVNRAKLNYWHWDVTTDETEETSRTWTGPDTRVETSQHTIDTDGVYTATMLANAALISWLKNIVRACALDTAVLDPTRVILSRLYAGDIRQLIEIGSRSVRHVIIDNAPPDVAADQTVVAGRLTIGAGLRTITLDLDLQPLTLVGLAPLRWADFPRPADVAGTAFIPVRFRDLSDNPYNALTARNSAAVTPARPV